MDTKYNHIELDKKAQEKWEKEQTYLAENNPGKQYNVDTPPPTVSGSLHIGHVFSYTHTDIAVRYKRMSGFCVMYPFGFDDNGLPTERYVEKKRGIRAHTMPRSEFIKICLEDAAEAAQLFKQLWQNIGLSVDWSKCYRTISDSTRKISQESFIRLYKKGHIYRKHEPAPYCTTCHTSVAQAELDDAQIPSLFNDIVFKDHKGNDLIIATTRPELLPSCVALLYHPNDERHQHLKSTQATVPIFDFTVPVLEDDGVDVEKGSGLVMVCTFGDKKDIEWYKKYDLPYKPSIGANGILNENAGIFAGLKVKPAREAVLEELRKQGLLLRQEAITHAVNVHERCHKEIEYLAFPQWFLNILDHKELFSNLADRINWHPEFMKSRYKNWVDNLSWDWCLSRQRFYGIPFPAWHCQDCNEILLAPVESLPVDPQEQEFPGKKCAKCSCTNIKPDTDIMDTWNTSSLTPYLCFKQYYPDTESPFTDERIKKFFPMSLRPQAHDIIRTWAFDTIVKTWLHHEMLPWTDIVISGHVLSDGKGKISKSKGGAALTPENLLKNYPADAIRFWTASARLGQDVAFSDNQLKIGQRLITKMWNAFRFIKEHIADKSFDVLPKQFGAVNEWLLHTATQQFANYQRYFENQEFGLALEPIEKFFWKDFCDNYLELIKDQLFNPDNYNEEQLYATRWTLHHVGLRILQMYAPYLVHCTENIYEIIFKNSVGVPSIHQTKFANLQQEYVFEKSTKTMQAILTVITQVRKLKTEKQLSLKTPLAKLTIHAQENSLINELQEQETLIRGVTQAEEIIYKEENLEAPELQEKNSLLHARVSTVEL